MVDRPVVRSFLCNYVVYKWLKICFPYHCHGPFQTKKLDV